MTDRRLFPGTDRVIWAGWDGPVGARRVVEGVVRACCQGVAAIRSGPGDSFGRERELVLHQRFRVLEERAGWCFGFALRDGYAGWMAQGDLGPAGPAPTHVVAARQSYVFPLPQLKSGAPPQPVSFAASFAAGANFEGGRWTEILLSAAEGPPVAYVPSAHLRPIAEVERDPVAVAERFVGTPYLWGGNSGFGIDCSGLVQAAHLACGIACPGDADLQEAALGAPLRPDEPLRRGDIVFWKGHVALMVDGETMIHANAHAMAVTYEPHAQALHRITAAGDGPVSSRRRL